MASFSRRVSRPHPTLTFFLSAVLAGKSIYGYMNWRERRFTTDSLMSPEMEEFRLRMLAHAKAVVARAPKVESEAGTNTSLVQPFLTALGYDVGNPEEVAPEHHADFSDKYQNKVDYAILHKGAPVIALESKRVEAAMKDDRGQLRSYFNACPTVKLGILTDGLKYEFYADSDKPNMMDDTAFLRMDFIEIDKNSRIDDNTLSGLATVRSGLFNPENVGAEAKRKLLFEAIVDVIKSFKAEPSDEFIRFVLCRPEVGKIGKVKQKIVESNRDVVRSAMETFVAQEALARFGYAPKDLIRTPLDRQDAAAATAVPQSLEVEIEGYALSDAESAVLSYVKNRLFYLVKNDILFQEVQKITFKKGRTTFRVYYERPNSGSIFDYRTHKDGSIFLQFPALENEEVPYIFSSRLDEMLLKVFSQRVSEAGVPVDAPPTLRAIQGGQAGAEVDDKSARA